MSELGRAKLSDVRDFKALYHRNGSAGESFYHCQFRHRDGRSWQVLNAIIFDKQIAVFSSEEPLLRFEGWYFESVLRENLAQQDRDAPNYAHQRS